MMMILSSSSVRSSAMAALPPAWPRTVTERGTGALLGEAPGEGRVRRHCPPAACSSCPAPLALLQAKINIVPPAAAAPKPLKGLCWGQPLWCHLWGGGRRACRGLVALELGQEWQRGGCVAPSPTVPVGFSPGVGRQRRRNDTQIGAKGLKSLREIVVYKENSCLRICKRSGSGETGIASINITEISHVVLGRPASLGVPPGAQKAAHGISLDPFIPAFSYRETRGNPTDRPTDR